LSSRDTTFLVILMLSACVPAAGGDVPPRALQPEEVLVVGNADSPDSVSLARFYAAARMIPQRNIVLVKTTTRPEISHQDYHTRIKRPIIQAMLERRLVGHIRSVCLIWGVPVRIAAVKKPTTRTAGQALEAMYRAAAQRAQYRLAIDCNLLPSVAKRFPQPRTEGLKPVAKLFPQPLPDPPAKLSDVEKLRANIRKLLARKQVEITLIKDPLRKRIAHRQMMAMHLDIYGLKGLIAYIKDAKLSDAPSVKLLGEQLDKAEADLADLSLSKQTLETARARLVLLERTGGLSMLEGHARKRAKMGTKPKSAKERVLGQTGASVDSELALLLWPKYPEKGLRINPLFWKVAAKIRRRKIPPTLMTARIDGPTAADARRVITDSIAVEKIGLTGTFYIDAGLVPRFAKTKKNRGYLEYDKRLRALHSFLVAHTRMKVVLDTGPALFAMGSCPDAALYVGWYSLKKYVPAFKWNRGAVGWHIASFEAADLRNPNSPQWCPRMLRNGVAATLGAVAEPTLVGFPSPEGFYPLLLTGKYTIAECYWRTVPAVSWQMTLIADPLYNPFKANPQVSLDVLPKGLAP